LVSQGKGVTGGYPRGRGGKEGPRGWVFPQKKMGLSRKRGGKKKGASGQGGRAEGGKKNFYDEGDGKTLDFRGGILNPIRRIKRLMSRNTWGREGFCSPENS